MLRNSKATCPFDKYNQRLRNYSKRFAALCDKPPLKLLGSHPVDVFASLEAGPPSDMCCEGRSEGSGSRCFIQASAEGSSTEEVVSASAGP